MTPRREQLLAALCWLMAGTLLLALLVLLGYLLLRGASGISLQLLFGEVRPLDALLLRRQVYDGLFPALLGSLLLIILTVAAALPLGLAAGIYLAEYAGGAARRLFSLLIDILTCLPSIVIGLAGLALTILLHRLFPGKIGPCLLISALALAFLVTPYIIRSVQLALESTPPLLRQTALALGAGHWQNIRLVLLPHHRAEIVGGLVLAVGRAAEDTAVIMLTGAVAAAGVPHSLFAPYEALPFYIYYISSQYMNAGQLQSGFSAALLLLVVCGLLLAMAALFELLARRRAGRC